MIDRKAFLIAGAFVTAMLAAALWRMSLLADWTQLPRYGEGGMAMSPVNSAVLLVPPGALVFAMILFTARTRMAVASDLEMQPWRGWMRLYLIPFSVIVAVMQAFVILRSLGLLTTVSPVLFSRAGFVVLGTLMMMLNNVVPKLPWLASRIGFLNLDPDRGARLLRFRGWMGFAFGLVVVLGGLLLPLRLMPPIAVAMTIASLMMGLFFRFTGKRNPVS